jgi:hypothetical protein
MMIVTRAGVAVAVASVLAFAAPARAQSAEAETLFREGKRLLKAGQIAQACEKLDASDRIEPTAGTELNLADCRERNGQLATAWAMFVKAASAFKHADADGKREAEARRRAAALEPQLVYLTIAVPADARVTGLVIKRNDAPFDPALWDQRVPVDPGDYRITGEAPGYEPWSTSVTMKSRSRKIEVPLLGKRVEPRRIEPVPAESAPRPADPGNVGDAAAVHRVAAPPARFTRRRTVAVVLTAAGVAAVGAGIGFGLHANGLQEDADALCPEAACADAHAVDLNHSARSSALYANLGFAAGGALIVTAAVLWFTGAPAARDAVSVIPQLDGDHVGVSLARAF